MLFFLVLYVYPCVCCTYNKRFFFVLCLKKPRFRHRHCQFFFCMEISRGFLFNRMFSRSGEQKKTKSFHTCLFPPLRRVLIWCVNRNMITHYFFWLNALALIMSFLFIWIFIDYDIFSSLHNEMLACITTNFCCMTFTFSFMTASC